MNNFLTVLQQKGLLAESDIESVNQRLAHGDDPLTAVLRTDRLSEEVLLRHLADALQYPFYETLDPFESSKSFLLKFPVRILLERQIAPVPSGNGTVLVLISNPFDLAGVDQLRLFTGQDYDIGLAPRAEISRYVRRHLGLGADTIQTMMDEAADNGLQFLTQVENDDVDLAEAAEGASIIRFVNQILTEAIEMRATDVHIEPFHDELQVRYRIDGVLQSATIPPSVKRFQSAIISRIKILSHLDIAEKRVPQDGRIKVVLSSSREVDIRVSIIPMLHGEAVVLRLLDCSSVLLGLDKLGMGPADLATFEEVIKQPHGIILVTGPTGSGKTTTLYAALSKINGVERKIVTIEDPIEYQLRGVNQIQVSTKTGLTFARGLRSILRHDPDVILVGEIRDFETAEIAVQASLTGHLVFSTLHTNDAPGALTRLVDMGMEAYLVASSLGAVLAQRLVRMICQDCREPLPDAETEPLRKRYPTLVPDRLYRGRGCKQCQQSGYQGRKGIFEQMVVSETIRALLMQNAGAGDIRRQAMNEGMKTLRQDAARFLHKGLTTLDEVLRVTKDDMTVHPAGGD
ncbi:MAG: Flp pilus assembly complex ATPase component TadA [Planctomycetales bacterium]|nr:Flp pilus assembly complex ATPase component TadA [Planctomycetales bacterium]